MADIAAPDDLDDLSDWILLPPAARAQGEADPVRMFYSAEAALAFLARYGGIGETISRRRKSRRLAEEPAATRGRRERMMA